MTESNLKSKSILKKIFIAGCIVLALFFVVIVAVVIYLIIPTDKNIGYKDEIAKYERGISNNPTRAKLLALKIESIADKKKQDQGREFKSEREISIECQNQIIDIRRTSIEDAYEIYNDQGYLFTEDCKDEIGKIQKSKYSDEIERACNYADDMTAIFNFIKPNNDGEDPDINQLEKEIKVACEAGSLAYGEELNKYLDANLKQIDQLSRYMYLKALAAFDDNAALGNFAKNAIRKLPLLEMIIKKTNRFVFITHTLKEIHEENKTIEELSFTQSPLRQELIRIAHSFGQSKKKEAAQRHN